ncbi:TPA: hypothetical protein NIA86_006514 [Pseudomonas aeruginosa]|nr:hypothetical protein [Pseudomonas aeruginosa]HCF5488250.1 hypothetical protein [Pseudomonas aeruginosa]
MIRFRACAENGLGYQPRRAQRGQPYFRSSTPSSASSSVANCPQLLGQSGDLPSRQFITDTSRPGRELALPAFGDMLFQVCYGVSRHVLAQEHLHASFLGLTSASSEPAYCFDKWPHQPALAVLIAARIERRIVESIR